MVVSAAVAVIWGSWEESSEDSLTQCLVVGAGCRWDLSCPVAGMPPRGLEVHLPDLHTIGRQVARLSLLGGPVRNCIVFYDLVSEVTQRHFCCSLGLSRLQGRGPSCP